MVCDRAESRLGRGVSRAEKFVCAVRRRWHESGDDRASQAVGEASGQKSPGEPQQKKGDNPMDS